MSPDNCLCACQTPRGVRHVTNDDMRRLLQSALITLPNLNCTHKDISPRSLRSGGAMALLCAKVPIEQIKLIGRWRSDAIFRCLHSQALPIVTPLAADMIVRGDFVLLPGGCLDDEEEDALETAFLRQSRSSSSPPTNTKHSFAHPPTHLAHGRTQVPWSARGKRLASPGKLPIAQPHALVDILVCRSSRRSGARSRGRWSAAEPLERPSAWWSGDPVPLQTASPPSGAPPAPCAVCAGPTL